MVLYKLLLQLLLIIGCVESNPGPVKKKRNPTKTCKQCVRFVKTGEDVCDKCLGFEMNSDPQKTRFDFVLRNIDDSSRNTHSCDLPRKNENEDKATDSLMLSHTFELSLDNSGATKGLSSQADIVQESTNQRALSEEIDLPAVSVPLQKPIVLNHPTTMFYAEACRKMNIPFGKFAHMLPAQLNPSDYPIEFYAIARNGNCLFGSLASLICGSNSVVLEAQLRSVICENLPLMPFTPLHYNLYGPDGCINGHEYIAREKMSTNGTYGGDLEIATFCNLFCLHVVVYVNESRRWMIYSPTPPVVAEHHMLLSLQNRHWEPIRKVYNFSVTPLLSTNLNLVNRPCTSTVHSKGEKLYCSLPVDETRKRNRRKTASVKGSKKMRLTCTDLNTKFAIVDDLLSQKAPHFLLRANFDTDFEIMRTNDKNVVNVEIRCDACQRFSTMFYPIILQPLPTKLICKRKYFPKFHAENVEVCSLCAIYSSTSFSPSWPSAWPCVINTLRKKIELSSKLPVQLLLSWVPHLQNDIKDGFLTFSENVFVDVTRQLIDFRRLLSTYKSADYVTAMKKYNFPSVRCFCGASVFLNECGGVGFNHLLNYMMQDFKCFKSNVNASMACIRPDYLDICDTELPFLLRPSIFVEDKGLQVATCRNHDGGTKLRMIHVPRHPTCGSLSHPHENRLAPIVPSLRAATTMKVGEFSSTWTMAKATGGAQGVGSLILHTKRRFNVKSDFILPEKEGLFIRHRNDMDEHLNEIAVNEQVSTKSFLSCSKSAKLTSDQLQPFLKSASFIPLNVSLAIKSSQDSENFVGERWVKPMLNTVCRNGVQPSLPSVSLTKSNYVMSLLHILFCNNRVLNSYLFTKQTDLSKFVANELLHDKISVQNKVNKFEQFDSRNSHSIPLLVQLLTTYTKVVDLSSSQSLQPLEDEMFLWYGTRCQKNLLEQFRGLGPKYFLLEEFSPIGNPFNIRLRYEDSDVWWLLNPCKGLSKIDESCSQNNRVRFMFACAAPTPPVSAMAFVSGQSKVKCPLHALLMCVDFRSSGYLCSSTKNCPNQSRWRCPYNDCFISLCQNHFIESEKKEIEFNYGVRRTVQSTNEPKFCNQSCSDESSSDEYFVPPIPISDEHYASMDTDAAVPSAPIEVPDNSSDMSIIPVQAILNSHMTVMHRTRFPNESTARFRRALQCFTATKPKCAISLMQLEGLLFPSIFYYQLLDGTIPGSLPFFLFCDQQTAKRFLFEDLLQHFSTRITDLTLPTSSSVQYIQFAVDCLINLSLGAKHSMSFFKRGLQTLQMRNEKIRLFSAKTMYDCNDGEIHLRELVAAVSSDPVDCFLTLSCNQMKNPGVAGIMQSTVSFYRKEPDEKKTAAMNAIMSTVLRAWTNSVYHLIDLLKNSKEKIIGKVKKIWARAEFQTTAGNLPHYHILIWCEPGTFSVDCSIQCAKKTIFNKLESIMESNLNLLSSYSDLTSKYELCVALHTHDCEKSKFRCMKRKDAQGNKICRTPPFPESHANWKMSLIRYYPEAALKILHELGLAEYVDRDAQWLQPSSILKSEKHMYAATKGEHFVATNAHLFLLTLSSTNLLATDPQMSCSYLTYYSSKVEEHADANIMSGRDGKNFRLRSEGVTNRHLSSVKHFFAVDKARERKVEKVECSLLSITEGTHWLLRKPIVITNMQFVHIPNVAAGERFVAYRTAPFTSPKINEMRSRDSAVEQWRRITESQALMLEDICRQTELYDKLAQFSLRPPELLCIDSVEVYYRCFLFSKHKFEIDELINCFQMKQFAPWIDCLNNWVRINEAAVAIIESYLNNQPTSPCKKYNVRILDRCTHKKTKAIWWLSTENSKMLPEIVFKSVSPRNALNFLIAFVLRFGKFATELELFSSYQLLDSFKKSGLIENRITYNRADVLSLLSLYTCKELIFLPGGSLSFSAKLLAADSAFSQLLNVAENEVNFDTPAVLLDHITEAMEQSAEDHLKSSQQSLFSNIASLNVHDLPTLLPNLSDRLTEWIPEVIYPEYQSPESMVEQDVIIDNIIRSVRTRCCTTRRGVLNLKNEIILGPPGSGKSHVCRIVLSYALMNGLVSMVTSLAARRANHLGGEHIHRLFGIPVKNLSASKMAEEAVLKLTRDPKRLNLVSSLQFVILEEISVVNAELLAAMDIVLQRVKDNYAPFGGTFILANGDCMQLPNVSGRDVFLSTALLYGFNFNFLTHLVRMIDPHGQRLLHLMEQRPIPDCAVEEIVSLFTDHCHFVETWEDVEPTIMRIFGKKSAEREAVQMHFNAVRRSGSPFYHIDASDELRLAGSHQWREASDDVSKFLDRTVRMPARILVYQSAILQFCCNMENVQQGSLAVVDYQNSTADSITVFVATNPTDINVDCLQSERFRQWRTLKVRKIKGFVQPFKANSVRRVQVPLANYVASNCHRILGDEFPQVATAVSVSESKYSLWLPSQLFVIGSRIPALNCLTFVGKKEATLEAIRSVLKTRNLHEERVYKFFKAIRDSHLQRTPIEIPSTPFLRSHFNVPKTAEGFIMVFVSLKDPHLKTMLIRETEIGLTDYLRNLNSCKVQDSDLYAMQPWTVAAYMWNFESGQQRVDFLDRVCNLRRTDCKEDVVQFCQKLRVLMKTLQTNIHFCFPGLLRKDTKKLWRNIRKLFRTFVVPFSVPENGTFFQLVIVSFIEYLICLYLFCGVQKILQPVLCETRRFQ